MISCLLISPLYGVRVIETDCEAPDSQENAFRSYPVDYPPYPGIAYETSYSTAQLVTAVLVGTAFFVIVGVALTNTSKNHGKNCHGKNSHSCHH